MNELERRAIIALIEVARASMDMAENTEHEIDDDEITVQREDFSALNAALDLLDGLPDNRPGYVMSGAARAEWALRRLLEA
jgi:hypothetical protein